MDRNRLEKMARTLFAAFINEMSTEEIAAISFDDMDEFKIKIQNRIYRIAPVEDGKKGFEDSLRGMEVMVFPFLMTDKKTQAIKKLRVETGWTLEESKEYCDALQIKMAKAGLIELPHYMKGNN